MEHVLFRDRTDDGFLTIDVDEAGSCTRTRLSGAGKVLDEDAGNLPVEVAQEIVERVRRMVDAHPEARGEARALVGVGDEHGPRKLVAIVGTLDDADADAIAAMRRQLQDIAWRTAPSSIPTSDDASRPPWWYWLIPGLQLAAIVGTLLGADVGKSQHAAYISGWLIAVPLLSLSGLLALFYFIELLNSGRHRHPKFSRSETILPAFALCVGAPLFVLGSFILLGR